MCKSRNLYSLNIKYPPCVYVVSLWVLSGDEFRGGKRRKIFVDLRIV